MFTEQEERILKLMVAVTIATIKLNKVNLEMGNEIRDIFNPLDAAKRAEYEPIIAPLQVTVKTAQDALKAECDSQISI